MLHAAAAALHLAAERQIAARGRLASAVTIPAHRPVGASDDPAVADCPCRTSPPSWTPGSPRLAPIPSKHVRRCGRALPSTSDPNLTKQRHFLISAAGIPPEFLRFDLLATAGRTAAATVALLEREGFEPDTTRQAVADHPCLSMPATPVTCSTTTTSGYPTSIMTPCPSQLVTTAAGSAGPQVAVRRLPADADLVAQQGFSPLRPQPAPVRASERVRTRRTRT